MGSESARIWDPIPTNAPQSDIAKTVAAEQALLDTAQATLAAQGVQQDKIVPNDIENTANQALTDNTAFDLFTIPVPDESGVVIEVRASIFCDDGTDHQAISILAHICAVNKGGTVTAVVTEGIADVVAASSGTLTLVVAAAEGDANILDVSVTANTSLTPSTFVIDWQATVIRGGALTKVNANA